MPAPLTLCSALKIVPAVPAPGLLPPAPFPVSPAPFSCPLAPFPQPPASCGDVPGPTWCLLCRHISEWFCCLSCRKLPECFLSPPSSPTLCSRFVFLLSVGGSTGLPSGCDTERPLMCVLAAEASSAGAQLLRFSLGLLYCYFSDLGEFLVFCTAALHHFHELRVSSLNLWLGVPCWTGVLYFQVATLVSLPVWCGHSLRRLSLC